MSGEGGGPPARGDRRPADPGGDLRSRPGTGELGAGTGQDQIGRPQLVGRVLSGAVASNGLPPDRPNAGGARDPARTSGCGPADLQRVLESELSKANRSLEGQGSRGWYVSRRSTGTSRSNHLAAAAKGTAGLQAPTGRTGQHLRRQAAQRGTLPAPVSLCPPRPTPPRAARSSVPCPRHRLTPRSCRAYSAPGTAGGP